MTNSQNQSLYMITWMNSHYFFFFSDILSKTSINLSAFWVRKLIIITGQFSVELSKRATSIHVDWSVTG
ncbi:hypothetical protein GYH30_008170 [Glycine max]|nr:hypothetical protein GYH30_008170 [Glycine max]